MIEQVIVILGQTATGKSTLAVKLAKKTGGEIISADSRQVYRGLNIGTGKITRTQMCGIPHHLLDVVNPKTNFTVVKFQTLALKKIKEILARGKVPIICGGTGFYIDAVTKGSVFPEVPPNVALRKKLSLRNDRMLMALLKKIDLERAKIIDPKNKARLIRAIEIAKALGKVPAITAVKPLYKFIKIGLYLPPKTLKKKIRERLLVRIKKGMIKETENLHKNGLSWRRMHQLGLEYHYLALYLQKKITKQEIIEKLNAKIYHYAKRQITWFKRDKEIKWLDASKKIDLLKIL